MIKRNILILILGVLIFSCGSKKRAARKKAEAKKEIVKKPHGVLNDNDVETTKPKINSTTNYISVYKNIAISEMKAYGIPASITLAQGILESGSGKGTLAVKANNHFGIKCHDWKGAKIYHDDDKRQECFRKYKNSNKSFRDHSEFLAKRGRYASLFKLDKDDYKGWANGLRRAGYATDKRYPQKLISLIERYKLYKFDDTVSKKKRVKKKIEYTVVKGDTLYSISRKYNITVKDLQSINGLEGTEISIGQVLNVNTREKN
jgi:flagellum-specific peptidoglycan hydrolase FlgJ